MSEPQLIKEDAGACPFCGSPVCIKASKEVAYFICSDKDSSCRGSGLFTCCPVEDVESAEKQFRNRAIP